MNIIVELVDRHWRVTPCGAVSAQSFVSGVAAFEAAAALLRDATRTGTAPFGRITVRAFGASVDALTVA